MIWLWLKISVPKGLQTPSILGFPNLNHSYSNAREPDVRCVCCDVRSLEEGCEAV